MTDAGVRAFEMVAALDYERTAGSPQEAQAARSIVSALHSIGLSPHTQTFEIPLYQITRASFSVTSPASNALFFGVTGYGHSGNTPPEGLEAPFIYIENGEDSLLAQASGCIALLNIQHKGASLCVPHCLKTRGLFSQPAFSSVNCLYGMTK